MAVSLIEMGCIYPTVATRKLGYLNGPLQKKEEKTKQPYKNSTLTSKPPFCIKPSIALYNEMIGAEMTFYDFFLPSVVKHVI